MSTTKKAEAVWLHTSLDCEVRALDEEKRTASFVAGTENGVMTYAGPEVLRMTGARLGRFRKNPVVLDTHNRYETDAIVGRASVSVDKDGRRLLADVTFADTPRAENVWRLVKGGFLRAVSIGFMPNRNKTKILREGERDGEGDSMVAGPAVIVREWELLELSMVPVPADEDALRRSLYDSLSNPENKEGGMKLSDVMEGARSETPAAPAGAPPAAQAASPTPAKTDSPEERQAQVLEARRRQVMAICPRGLEDVAEAALLEGLDLEGARKRLLEAKAARSKPVGTPEAPVQQTTSAEAKARSVADTVAGAINLFGMEG